MPQRRLRVVARGLCTRADPQPPPFLLSTSSPIHLFPVPRHQKTKDEIFEMMKGILEEQKCDVPTSADDPKCKINLEQFKKLVTDDK